MVWRAYHCNLGRFDLFGCASCVASSCKNRSHKRHTWCVGICMDTQLLLGDRLGISWNRPWNSGHDHSQHSLVHWFGCSADDTRHAPTGQNVEAAVRRIGHSCAEHCCVSDDRKTRHFNSRIRICDSAVFASGNQGCASPEFGSFSVDLVDGLGDVHFVGCLWSVDRPVGCGRTQCSDHTNGGLHPLAFAQPSPELCWWNKRRARYDKEITRALPALTVVSIKSPATKRSLAFGTPIVPSAVRA